MGSDDDQLLSRVVQSLCVAGQTAAPNPRCVELFASGCQWQEDTASLDSFKTALKVSLLKNKRTTRLLRLYFRTVQVS